MNVLIAGEVAITFFLARRLLLRRHRVTILHASHPAAVGLARDLPKATVIYGDATDPRILEQAETSVMDVVLALTGADEKNLAICQQAQRRFRVPRTLASVNDPDNEEVFRQLGVGSVFSPIRWLGTLLQERTDFQQVLEVMEAAEGRIKVTEVRLPGGSPAADQRLQDLDLPGETLVACILRGEQAMVPHGGTRLLRDDRLLIVTRTEDQDRALRVFVGNPG